MIHRDYLCIGIYRRCKLFIYLFTFGIFILKLICKVIFSHSICFKFQFWQRDNCVHVTRKIKENRDNPWVPHPLNNSTLQSKRFFVPIGKPTETSNITRSRPDEITQVKISSQEKRSKCHFFLINPSKKLIFSPLIYISLTR